MHIDLNCDDPDGAIDPVVSFLNGYSKVGLDIEYNQERVTKNGTSSDPMVLTLGVIPAHAKGLGTDVADSTRTAMDTALHEAEPIPALLKLYNSLTGGGASGGAGSHECVPVDLAMLVLRPKVLLH